MPVVYSTKTGSKGFYPCSKVYQQVLLNAIQERDYVTVQELFQQSHRLVWRLGNGANVIGGRGGVGANQVSGSVYHNIYDSNSTITVQEYNRISGLEGSEITPQLIKQQCGGAHFDRKITGFLGPQLSSVGRAMNKMQRVQKASYDAASRNGFPVDGFKGLGLYAPSPFEQEQDYEGVYRPQNPEHNEGLSSGYCDEDTEPCAEDLECQNNVCVVPTARRQCPPFQYPVTLEGKDGKFTVNNVSAERKRPIRQYSGFWNQWYDTCIPAENQTTQRWVTDQKLRSYIGLAFDVVQLPVEEWIVRKGDQKVLYDPSTYAPYFLEKDDATNEIKRFYKLRSAYTPNIPLSALSLPLPSSPSPHVAPYQRTKRRREESNVPLEVQDLLSVGGEEIKEQDDASAPHGNKSRVSTLYERGSDEEEQSQQESPPSSPSLRPLKFQKRNEESDDVSPLDGSANKIGERESDEDEEEKQVEEAEADEEEQLQRTQRREEQENNNEREEEVEEKQQEDTASVDALLSRPSVFQQQQSQNEIEQMLEEIENENEEAEQ